PKEVEEKAIQEMKRLEAMPPMSAEATVSRNYLDWLIAVPWHKKTRESRDLKRAEEILHEDHYGLDKIKERILEFLAVRALVKKPKATILTFAGPPGVGKTSLAKSIARATGRKFVRLSLGGVHDEAEIRGHRRTYIGALPGQIMQGIRRAETNDPVFMLDEIDKLGSDFRGDPASALLEVLDPAQNYSFRDHYLDVELDLSEIVFIATGNMAETIPGPLLDRMEVIRFDGYTTDEKVAIARGYLWPRQRERNGLREDEVSVSDELLGTIVSEYTREAGVRQLERELGKLLRKTAARIAGGDTVPPIAIDEDAVVPALGRPRFFPEVADRTATPGVATGLAVTGTGGDVLFIEANTMDGEGLT
ncbi:MAG: AAA family ATPase, partial [Burkholderiales bacterium]